LKKIHFTSFHAFISFDLVLIKGKYFLTATIAKSSLSFSSSISANVFGLGKTLPVFHS